MAFFKSQLCVTFLEILAGVGMIKVERFKIKVLRNEGNQSKSI